MRRPSRWRRTVVVAALALGACLPATALAAPTARLNATFSPLHLARRTTLGFGFELSAAAGQTVPPLVAMSVSYPANLGIALSGLGLAKCSPAALRASGPSGCPVDSIMGRGSARAQIPIDSKPVQETAAITVLRTAEREGHLALLFFAAGRSPVDAQVVFTGALLPAPPPFGGRVSMEVPLVPTIPGGPDVSVVEAHVTIGPRGVTYYEHVEGMTLAYQPKGILLPRRCPRGGFPFAATFGFLDGSTTAARTAIPCPRGGSRGSARHRLRAVKS